MMFILGILLYVIFLQQINFSSESLFPYAITLPNTCHNLSFFSFSFQENNKQNHLGFDRDFTYLSKMQKHFVFMLMQ